MKTIAVLSDTHGNIADIDKLSGIFSESDYIIHLGDNSRDMFNYKKIYGSKLIQVNGNCDFSGGNKQGILEIEGVKIFYTHGDLFGVKQGTERILDYAESIGANVALYGHTHVAEISEINGVQLINPGNVTKYSTDKSFCYLIISNGKAVASINRNAFLY